MNDGIYTLELLDSSSNGWTNHAGYYLTIDVGEMIFEMGQVPSGVASVSTMFSSYLPFQINYSDWKVNKEYVDNWNSESYDDSAWSSVKASEIGTNTEITTYIRHDVNIPDINNYHVLNVRVKYAGGVAAYFNERLVARFNLEEDFDSSTEAITVHDQDTFSKFHVIMSTVGAVTGKNVMAFEIHRPADQPTSSNVIFDATGVFGVNECSIVVDTYSLINGTDPYSGTFEQLLDLDPTNYGYQPNTKGTYLEWTVENLEGTKFNSFAIHSPFLSTSYGFSLYLRSNEKDRYISALAVTDQSTWPLLRHAWSVPLGIAGFRQVKSEVDAVASTTVIVSSYILQYCKPTGSGVCPGEGDYPSVDEGETTYASCGYGYRGYSYRKCSNNQLGEINSENCVQKAPAKLMYDASMYNLVLDTDIHIAAPTYLNLIEEFYLADNTSLPLGLLLNSETGEISGRPTQESASNTYTVYGRNQVGKVFTTVSLSVQKGTCKEEGNFPTTNVGEVAVYDCSLGGFYVGTQRRACALGETDGEWQDISGSCMSITLIIVLVVVIAVVIAFIVVYFVCINKRTKSVRNVKKGTHVMSTSKASSNNGAKV